MKNFITFFILCLLTVQFSFAEKFQKAVVTDVNYLLRSNMMVSQNTFPFYFHHQEFIDDIQSDIQKYVKQRFKVDTVTFLSPGVVNYTSGAFALPEKAKETANKLHEKETVYLAVETILQMGTSVNGESSYVFFTRINAYNSNGKRVFKFKNKIPFTPVRGDEIVGLAEMSEQDFYAFYFDGLQFAFEGKMKKVEKRFIQKPPTNHFDEFLGQAEKFYLLRERKGYSYGRELQSVGDVIVFKNNFWKSSDSDFNIDNLFKGNKVKDSYYLTNLMKKEDYSVTLKASDKTVLDFLSITSDVKIEIKSRDKELLGNFSYSYNNLDGTFRGKHYKINWLPEYQCAEVISDNSLKILINELGKYKVIYIHNSVSEEELGDVFNLAFMFDFAAQVQQKLAEKSAEN